MSLISVENLEKYYGERKLFSGVSFEINPGEKIALVGANGTGKSTLMKILNGIEGKENGEIRKKNNLTISYLPQQPEVPGHLTAFEYVSDNGSPSSKAFISYNKALEKGDHDQIEKFMSEVDRLQAWNYDNEVKEVMTYLGITDFDKEMGKLSGGLKRRAALSKVILEDPDLMILDEPTNHLDIDAIVWLENHLKTSKSALFLVTHDRYFLDSVCKNILDLDHGGIRKFEGPYDNFIQKKEELLIQAANDAEKAANLLKKELEWSRRQPKARTTKAKYRLDAIDDLKNKARQPKVREQVKIDFDPSLKGKKILELNEISKSFSDKTLFNSFSYIFKKNDRIGLVGPNGSGKSTFLKIITGEQRPDSGEIIKGQNTNFGYFKQEDPIYKQDEKVIDRITNIAEMIKVNEKQTLSATQVLQLFQFEPKRQHEYAYKLSGGEKKRLQLLEVLVKRPNFLILDEPTNDLDLQTLDALGLFLSHYDGCILIVSHDRYLLDTLADHLFVIDNQQIRYFPGSYDDFRQIKEEENKQEEKEIKKTEKKETENYRQKEITRKLTFKEKRELEDLEKKIEELESKKSEAITEMNSGISDHNRLTELGKIVEQIDNDLEEITLRWMELEELNNN
ncbi:ABC-F family ATP-binding cassette domain-containing protein [Marinigracilibium pacificum]|uniref:ABC-F family ATP-binding cassette domain-containing protein n=1 Tax=Marinigracilibium pacificum TaxID=2729599 RepID=A0A848J3J4_9BACT|nr:ABC-F family ATP-binding cassette domain-containing protein [Marinigracilibium pacificum]NMM49100.1 ABC-F family ATP-binding cassette domain-containing protein [Marinigracilibium pacificum]